MVNIKKKKRVVVAMSGGVDSSVTACLLKEQGYEVIGITLQLYASNSQIAKGKTCCAGQDIYDAKEVARQIGIKHYVLDYKKSFHDNVIRNFVESYKNGFTPIPCVQCNQYIKFSELLSVAKSLGADFLATGHYIKSQLIGDEHGLFVADDKEKDQSYFLFQTKKKDLNFLRFPLGSISKIETRKLAEKYEITVANKLESQDICFIPDGNYRKFLSKYQGFGIRGEIVDLQGNVLGEHGGIENYTIGQRKKLNISTGFPMYVIKILRDENKIVIGKKEKLEEKKISISNFNWIGPGKKEASSYLENIKVKVRARQDPVLGTINFYNQNTANVNLSTATYGVAKGQGCVFYSKDNQLLGGGWIV